MEFHDPAFYSPKAGFKQDGDNLISALSEIENQDALEIPKE